MYILPRNPYYSHFLHGKSLFFPDPKSRNAPPSPSKLPKNRRNITAKGKFFSKFLILPRNPSKKSLSLETFGFGLNTFCAALKSGIVSRTIILTGLLYFAANVSSTVDNLPHVSHTPISLADTSAEETGTISGTLGVAGWHLWHGCRVFLLTCRSIVSVNTHRHGQQTRKVGGKIALVIRNIRI